MEIALSSTGTLCSFKVIPLSGKDGLDSLLPRWMELLPRALNPSFLHEPPWSWSVATSLQLERVVFYTVYDNDQLIAVVPLEHRVKWYGPVRMRSLHLPADSNIYLNDIVLDRNYANQDVLDAVLKEISSPSNGFKWDYCELRKFNSRSALYAHLEGRGIDIRQIGESVFIPCRDAADIQKISKKTWKNASRLSRKAAAEVGELALIHNAPGEPMEPWFEDFMRIESSGWKGEEGTGTSLLVDLKGQTFFRSLIVDNAGNWETRVYVLRFGDVKVASVLCVRCGPVLYVLKQGYNEEYKAYGPGSILIKTLIEIMATNPDIIGINLTTAPPWSDRWHFDRASVHEAMLPGGTFRGKIYQVLYHLKCRLSPLKSKLIAGIKGAKV